MFIHAYISEFLIYVKFFFQAAEIHSDLKYFTLPIQLHWQSSVQIHHKKKNKFVWQHYSMPLNAVSHPAWDGLHAII